MKTYTVVVHLPCIWKTSQILRLLDMFLRRLSFCEKNYIRRRSDHHRPKTTLHVLYLEDKFLSKKKNCRKKMPPDE